jgi:hypothetical protein
MCHYFVEVDFWIERISIALGKQYSIDTLRKGAYLSSNQGTNTDSQPAFLPNALADLT